MDFLDALKKKWVRGSDCLRYREFESYSYIEASAKPFLMGFGKFTIIFIN